MEKLKSPIGKVKFPKTIINGKDMGFAIQVPGNSEDYDVPDREDSWSFNLILDPNKEEVRKFIALLDEKSKEIKGVNFQPYKNDKDKLDDGTIVENGMIAVNFKSVYPPKITDSKRQLFQGKVTWGSLVRVAFVAVPIINVKGNTGLGKYFSEIQIVELSESRESCFDEIEGGYVAPVPSAKDDAIAALNKCDSSFDAEEQQYAGAVTR